MSSHYVCTKEGISNVLGLSSVTEVARYERTAKKEGFIPFIICDGIRYYDYDQLLRQGDAPNFLAKAIEEQIKEAHEKHVQLTLDFK